MDPTPATAMATARGAEDEEDEWELIIDDGFVYERKKRRRLDGPDPDAAAPVAGVLRPPDPKAEETSRRERRRRILSKLRRKYKTEINRWEILSNGLRAMQEKADRFQKRRREAEKEDDEAALCREKASISGGAGDAAAKPESLIDELLSLAEAQEAFIQDVTSLCDVAEEMCRVREEQLKEPFFDHPIWGSPRELMASLCDE